MKRAWMWVGCVCLAVTVVGCQRNEPDVIVAEDLDRPVSPGPAALKYEKLEDLPPVVAQAFLRQYPRAAVTGIDTLVASTGETMYQIVFIRDGDAAEVVYDTDGKVVRAPVNAPTR